MHATTHRLSTQREGVQALEWNEGHGECVVFFKKAPVLSTVAQLRTQVWIAKGLFKKIGRQVVKEHYSISVHDREAMAHTANTDRAGISLVGRDIGTEAERRAALRKQSEILAKAKKELKAKKVEALIGAEKKPSANYMFSSENVSPPTFNTFAADLSPKTL